jgi:UDP-glucose 4-epimerase
MEALVLGGCGFIGSHVVDALIAEGHSVTVLDRSPEHYRQTPTSVRYEFADFGDRMTLFRVLTGKDVVFHLVSTTVPGISNFDPRADVSGNLLGTLGLIEAMTSLDIRRIVYLSSGGTVYGNAEKEPIPEDHPLRPINSYGIVKVAVESYLELYHRTHGLNPIVIRPSNPFGPRQGHTGVQGVISTFLRRIRNGQPIEIWGDGSVVRDYLYVVDLADLCVRAATANITGVLNAGSGVGRSLTDIVAAVTRTTGSSIDPIFKPGRAVDVPRSVLDVSRAKDLLGWTASTDFDFALIKTWKWIQKNAN